RALIERELGPPGTRADPAHVSAVLEQLGTPEDLVTEERTRIDRGWVKSRAPSKEEGEAAAAALTGPLNRSLTGRRRPGGATQRTPGTAPNDPGTGPVTPAEGTPVARPPGAGPRSSGPRSAGPRSTGLRGVGPRSAGLRSAGPQSSGPGSGGLRSAGPQSSGPGSGGLRSAGPPGKAAGPHGLRGEETPAPNPPIGPGNLLETIAIPLLRPRGPVLSFPFLPDRPPPGPF